MKNRTAFWGLIGCLLLLEFIAFQFEVDMHNPQLVDTDCYMRLVRVEQLYASHNWYDATIPRSNWPYGETLHWSRLLDLLLITGASLGVFFVEFKTALFWSGIVISPMLHVASMAILFWAALPLFRQDEIVRLGFLFLTQMGIWGYYCVGRPDHHSLLLTLFILLLGCCNRMLSKRENSLKYGAYSGFAAATALWVSIESVAAIFMVESVLVVLWIWKKEEFANKAAVFSLSLLICSIVYILVETMPAAVTAVVYDKLSIVHIVIFLLTAMFWTQACLLQYTNVFSRIGATSIYIYILGTVLSQNFPGFFHGPYAGIDPRIVPLWLNKVQEVQPLFDISRKGLAKMLFYIGPLVVCLPYMVYALIMRGVEFNRKWLMYAAGMVVYIPLSMYQMRWAAYAEAVMIFPLAFILQQCLLRLAQIGAEQWRILTRALVTVAFCLGFIGLSLTVAPPEEEKKIITVTKMAAFLNEFKAVPATILADVDFGPELLYRTHHRVVATPYHRNGDGIIFVYEVMTAKLDSEAYRLLQQRDIDLILLCPALMRDIGGDVFYQRLLAGQRPSWLKQVELPKYLEGDMYLYEVLRDQEG